MGTNTSGEIGLDTDCWENDQRALMANSDNLNCLKKNLMDLFSKHFKETFNILQKAPNSRELRIGLTEIICFYYSHKNIMHRKVVHKVMRRQLPTFCVQKQVSDSNIICDVLTCIDEMNDHIPASLAVFLMSAMNRQHHSIPADRIGSEESHVIFLKYFLNHTRKIKFTIGEKRLQELLLDANPNHLITTFLYSNTDSVRVVLQFGTRLFDGENESSKGTQTLLACALEFIIYCGVTNGAWDALGRLKVSYRDFTSYVNKMLVNFQLILQTVTNPHVAMRNLAGIDLGSYKMKIMDVQNLQEFLNTIYPGAEFAVVRAPSLIHLCRAAIRHALFENWQLPEGIYALNLPKKIKEYINLTID